MLFEDVKNLRQSAWKLQPTTGGIPSLSRQRKLIGHQSRDTSAHNSENKSADPVIGPYRRNIHAYVFYPKFSLSFSPSVPLRLSISISIS